jgi:hypothetical protein
VEGSCEHGNETSGFIKCWDIFEWLSDSSSWSLLVINITLTTFSGFVIKWHSYIGSLYDRYVGIIEARKLKSTKISGI